MIFRSLLIWTVGAAMTAYTPTAPEILSKMAVTLRKAEPVEARVVREGPEGDVFEEVLVTVPGRAGNIKNLQTALDLPYALVTLPAEDITETLPSIASDDTKVTLGRLSGKVCFILEGQDERLWVTKDELIPLKIEILSGVRLGTAYLYLDMIKLSDKVQYPSRTEVWRGDELILIERLLPDAASTEEP